MSILIEASHIVERAQFPPRFKIPNFFSIRFFFDETNPRQACGKDCGRY